MNWKVFAALAFVGLGLFLTARFYMKPAIYPGDVVEERECRWCGGTGVNGPDLDAAGAPGTQPGAPCIGCRGRKRLQVIVPGPNHPALVKGTVRDAAVVGSQGHDPEAAAMSRFVENRNPMEPVQGALSGAKLVMESGGQRLEIPVAKTGRFRFMLAPGSYQVTISAPGYKTATTTLQVPQRRAPIWDEKARLVTEEQEADTVWADFALDKDR